MNRLNTLSCHMNTSSKHDFSKYFKHYSLDDILIRELEENDYNNGFIKVLGNLTKVSEVAQTDFVRTVRTIQSSPNLHLIIVAVEKKSNKIVGSGCVFVEKKIIRNLGKIGHIEDIVVDSSMRGKNLGRIIVECLTRVAFEEEKVYKVILDCSEKNVGFYNKLNYKMVQNEMGIYGEVFNQKYTNI